MNTDTDRLDYMIRKNFCIKDLDDTYMVLDCTGYPVSGSEFDNAREAIDYEMSITP